MLEYIFGVVFGFTMAFTVLFVLVMNYIDNTAEEAYKDGWEKYGGDVIQLLKHLL